MVSWASLPCWQCMGLACAAANELGQPARQCMSRAVGGLEGPVRQDRAEHDNQGSRRREMAASGSHRPEPHLPAPVRAHLAPSLRCRLGQLAYISVRGVSQQFADPPGAPLHWRQNADYSGLNILMMGIFYEALQRWVEGRGG